MRAPALALLALLASAGSARAGGGAVVINEIHYAANAAAAGLLKYEYVELYANTTAALGGWVLQDLSSSNLPDPLFTFPALTLPAGAFLVIVSSTAAGVVPQDTDLSDGSGLLIATSLWTTDLANAGDAVLLRDPAVLQDFVYYDEVNTGDPSVDNEAVLSGFWKAGAAIDVLSSATTGRAIALRVDGAATNEVNPIPDSEDLDWKQYPAIEGGTPGAPNSGPLGLSHRQPGPAGFHGIQPSPVVAGGASFRFTLASAGRVGFEILDITGRAVASVPAAWFEAGPAEVVWTAGRSRAGGPVPAGVYVVEMIVVGRPVGARKLVLLQ